MSEALEKLVLGYIVSVFAGIGAVMGESHLEFKSMFADTPVRVEAPNQLARNSKHKLIVGHDLVSGTVIKKGNPIQGSYQGMKSQFFPYTFKTKAGETYNAASRRQIFNLGDNVTALLGWAIDCGCEVPYRIIEAYQPKAN